MDFSENLSFKIAMSRQVLSQVNLLVNLFSKLYVTFILQWIAFIFDRNEEEDQQMFHMQERQVTTLFII